MNKEMIRTIKFTLVSISAGIIQFGLFTLINIIFDCNYWIAYLPSLIASVIWNFTINKNVTFKSATNVPVAMFKVFIYYLIFTPLSTIGGSYLEKLGLNKYLIEILCMFTNFVTEYLYDRFYVFKNSIDTK